MNRLTGILNIVEHALNDKKKRHIIGGVLVSVTLLFAGLAVTAISAKSEDEKNEQICIE